VAELQARIQAKARAQMASSAGQPFIEARNPQRVQAARHARVAPMENSNPGDEPSGPHRQGRRGTEVTCANPDCGAVFCPL
jgi:hypothetical protein